MGDVGDLQRVGALLTGDPTITNRADLARELGVSRARVTQVLGLLDLAQEIQETLLVLQDQDAIRFFSERRLRPLLHLADHEEQVRRFGELLARFPKGGRARDN